MPRGMCVFRHPNFYNSSGKIQIPKIDMLKCNLFHASTKPTYDMH